MKEKTKQFIIKNAFAGVQVWQKGTFANTVRNSIFLGKMENIIKLIKKGVDHNTTPYGFMVAKKATVKMPINIYRQWDFKTHCYENKHFIA